MARYPVAWSTWALTTLEGGVHGAGAGRSRYASFMTVAQTGAASRPPLAPGMIDRGLSNPSQTPAARSGVSPTNQTSLPSFVVPVFPAAGSQNPPSRIGRAGAGVHHFLEERERQEGHARVQRLMGRLTRLPEHGPIAVLHAEIQTGLTL